MNFGGKGRRGEEAEGDKGGRGPELGESPEMGARQTHTYTEQTHVRQGLSEGLCVCVCVCVCVFVLVCVCVREREREMAGSIAGSRYPTLNSLLLLD